MFLLQPAFCAKVRECYWDKLLAQKQLGELQTVNRTGHIRVRVGLLGKSHVEAGGPSSIHRALEQVRQALPPSLAIALQMAVAYQARAENHVDYRYEDYLEENGRMHIQTHAVHFGAQVHKMVSLEGELVYDAVSGASPNGALPTAGTRDWLKEIHPDARKAGNLSSAIHYGVHPTTPQFAYSLENDYESTGVSLNHTIDFNEKNTTLALGAAYTHDNIYAVTLSEDKHKDSWDFLVGLTQLLGPKTVFTLNLTYGTASGYLSDPYKQTHIPFYPDPAAPDPLAVTFGEQRPGKRDKHIGYVSLSQFVTPLRGSAELGYRLYHDTYGILSHTVSLNWYQKIGKHVVLSPMFRFTDQSAADFYMTQLPGDPGGDPPYYAPLPALYSSDYRLAALQSFTYGIGVTAKIKDRVSLDFAFKRYEMLGKDGVTSPLLFPKANIFSAGLRVWF